jgi:ElaB/YqjD/DUF883 family membrane-anchored ribosome-binding protein
VHCPGITRCLIAALAPASSSHLFSHWPYPALFIRPFFNFKELDMKNPNTNLPSTQEALTGARHLSEQMISGAEHAVESSRSLANETLDKAESKVRQLRGSIDPMVDKLATQAQKLARQSMDMAAEASDRAQRSMHRYADATTRYVANEPVKAVLIAAAVGAAVALLVASTRNRDSR